MLGPVSDLLGMGRKRLTTLQTMRYENSEFDYSKPAGPETFRIDRIPRTPLALIWLAMTNRFTPNRMKTLRVTHKATRETRYAHFRVRGFKEYFAEAKLWHGVVCGFGTFKSAMSWECVKLAPEDRSTQKDDDRQRS
jgi:hypothetical protein